MPSAISRKVIQAFEKSLNFATLNFPNLLRTKTYSTKGPFNTDLV